MTLDVLVQEQSINSGVTSTLEGLEKPKVALSSNIANDLNSSNLVSSEKIPISIRSEYKLTPSLIDMARMTENDLSRINNLCIQNEHGKITWPGHTDARQINFDELVIIEPYSATVYPEEVENCGGKPVVGLGLNKMAIIELYHISPPANLNDEGNKRFEENLKKKTATMDDTEFINYDHKKETLLFKVSHFTKYSFLNMENDADQQSDNAESQEEEQNADVESVRMQNDQGRFSFNPNQSRPVNSSISKNTEIEREDEDQKEYEMEVDAIKVGHSNTRLGYLEQIEEDSESKLSSAIAKSDEFQQYQKRGSKIQYSVQQVKEFEDQSYQQHEIDHEEDEEEISYSRIPQQKPLSQIREEIRMRKEQIKVYID